MKPRFHSLFHILPLMITLHGHASAADVIKANNTTALNVASSFTTTPLYDGTDTAVWNSTVTAANTVALGANLSFTGIRIANPTGAVVVTNATGNILTLGTSGVDMSAATVNLTLLNSVAASDIAIGGNQIWNVAASRTLTLFGTSNSLNQRLTGSGNIQIITAGGAGTMGVVALNTGDATGTGFSGGGNAGYSGNWTIGNGGNATGTTAATSVNTGSITILRHALNAWGSGTITLNGGQIASVQGNWSWTNAITLQDGTTSNVLLASGTSRALKLNGVISSSGSINFLSNGTAQTLDRGYILTGTNIMSGTVTIASGAFVRVGGVAETNASPAATLSLLAGTTGTLGTAAVTNNGTLTLSRSDAWTFGNNVSGTGVVNIGSSAITNSGTQVVTMSGTNNYIGATTVGAGRLNLTGTLTSNITVQAAGRISGTGSTTGLLTLNSGGGIALAGGVTTASIIANGATFSGSNVVTFLATPVNTTVYDVFTYGAGAVTNIGNLSVPYRGTLADDPGNQKYTFTAGEVGATRTWNTTTGTWAVNTGTNFVEGDQKFFAGDHVIFPDIASDSTVTLSGPILPGSVTVSNTANTYTFTGTAIDGVASLAKSGAGTLTLASANSYSGGTTLSAGTLVLGNANAIGTGALTITGGSLDSSVVNLVNSGNNAQNWNGDFTFTGTQNLNLGTGAVTMNANRQVTVTANTLTVGGVISGSGFSLTKAGNGALTLTNANTYSGGTTLTAGILRVGNNSAFGAGALALNGGTLSSDSGTLRTLANNLTIGGNVAFGDGTNAGQLVFDGTADLQGSNRVLTSVLGTQGARFSGVISNGGITMEGTGRITLANDGNTFTGGTTINGGILATSLNALASSGSVTIGNGGSLAIGSNGTTTINNLSGVTGSVIRTDFNLDSDGARTLSVNQTTSDTFAGTFTQGGGGRTISLIKSGSAILGLTGSVNYTGDTTVSQGTLAIGGGGGIYRGGFRGTQVLTVGSGAILELQNWNYNETTGSLGGLANQAARIVINGGTIRMTGTTVYGRGVTVNAGGATFEAATGTTWTFDDTGDGNIAFVYNDDPSLTFAGDGSFVFNKSFSGTGALTKSGDGTLTLPTTNTHTGATTVTDGTLAVTGSLGNTAVTVESGATISGNGNLGGSLTIEAGGTHALAVAATPGAQVTRAITGALDLSEIGDILALTAASPPADGTYILATATGGITGTPESVTQSGVSGTFAINGNNLELTVSSGSPFDTWAAAEGLDGSPGKEAGFDDDPDGDGVANGLEWILGGNPLDGQSGSLISTTATASGGLTLDFTRNEDSIGEATLTVQYNTDLGTVWSNATIGATSSGPDANGVTIDIDTGAAPDEVTVNIPASNSFGGKLFARLKATQP